MIRPGASMRLAKLNDQTRIRIKIAVLTKLAKENFIRADEVEPLLYGPYDAVLDRLFEHCDYFRVHLPGGQFIEVHPGYRRDRALQ